MFFAAAYHQATNLETQKVAKRIEMHQSQITNDDLFVFSLLHSEIVQCTTLNNTVRED